MNEMADNKKVLVVDDEASLVDLCSIILAQAGYDVRTALNGPDALTAVAADCPDLILLDVMMPGMDGIEVCRHIRDRHSGTPPHIFMFTADERDDTRVSSLEAGANGVITKEVPIFELPDHLTAFL